MRWFTFRISVLLSTDRKIKPCLCVFLSKHKLHLKSNPFLLPSPYYDFRYLNHVLITFLSPYMSIILAVYPINLIFLQNFLFIFNSQFKYTLAEEYMSTSNKGNLGRMFWITLYSEIQFCLIWNGISSIKTKSTVCMLSHNIYLHPSPISWRWVRVSCKLWDISWWMSKVNTRKPWISLVRELHWLLSYNQSLPRQINRIIHSQRR